MDARSCECCECDFVSWGAFTWLSMYDKIECCICFLFCRDLTRNQITSLLGAHPNGNTSKNTSTSSTAFRGLSKLHDLHLGYNNISAIGVDIFKHLVNLKVL